MKKKTAALVCAVLTVCVAAPSGAWADTRSQDENADEAELKLAAEEEEEVREEEDEQEEEAEEEVKTAAISMPDKEDRRQNSQALFLKEELDALGFQTELKFSGNEKGSQEEDVKNWVTQGVDLLVIHPAKEADLAQVLEEAGQKGIPILSYGALIQNTADVDWLVTYDYLASGRQIGEFIVEKEDLETVQKEEGTRTIEFFMGDSRDTFSLLFYTGLMEVLTPYLEDGVLECRSGRISLDLAGIEGEEKEAGDRVSEILDKYYPQKAPDIICTASDAFAQAAVTAVDNKKYVRSTVILDGDRENKEKEETEQDQEEAQLQEEVQQVLWPLITGREITLEGAVGIKENIQAASTYGDDRELAVLCARTAKAFVEREEMEEQTEQYDNGVKIVPSSLCPVRTVNQENFMEVLVEGGVYTQEELGIEDAGR